MIIGLDWAGLRVSGKRVVGLVRRVVTLAGHEVQSLTECDLLKLLVAQASKVLTHQQILRQAWGYRRRSEI